MSKPAATTTAGPARAPAGDPTPDQQHRSARSCPPVDRDLTGAQRAELSIMATLGDAEILDVIHSCLLTPAALRDRTYRLRMWAVLRTARLRGI